jgi:hypothetical protein
VQERVLDTSENVLLKEHSDRTTLQWELYGLEFEDGSKLEDWTKIEKSPWHWQYDNHELTFNIYEHLGQFWKLYLSRWVLKDTNEYQYRYGGQACRMAKVQYKLSSRSPHSGIIKEKGELEWVRIGEVDEKIHKVLRM